MDLERLALKKKQTTLEIAGTIKLHLLLGSLFSLAYLPMLVLQKRNIDLTALKTDQNLNMNMATNSDFPDGLSKSVLSKLPLPPPNKQRKWEENGNSQDLCESLMYFQTFITSVVSVTRVICRQHLEANLQTFG